MDRVELWDMPPGILDGAEEASLRGYRLAALEGSRKMAATS